MRGIAKGFGISNDKDRKTFFEHFPIKEIESGSKIHKGNDLMSIIRDAQKKFPREKSLKKKKVETIDQEIQTDQIRIVEENNIILKNATTTTFHIILEKF